MCHAAMLQTMNSRLATARRHALLIRQRASQAFKKTLSRTLSKRLNFMRGFLYDAAIKKT
jgi:hypothetical protein